MPMDEPQTRHRLRELWSPRLTALLITSILLLGAVSLLAAHSLATLRAGSAWVVQTERVRFEIGHVLQLLTDVETGMRGYALSGNKQFLDPYHAALPLLPDALSNLKQLVADNPAQRASEAELESRAQACVTYAEGVIGQIESGDVAAGRTIISSGEGKRRTDAARSVAAQMQAEEMRLLELRRRSSDEALHETQLALWVTGALAAILLLVIAYSAVRYGARMRRGEKTLATTLRNIGDGVISTDAAGAVQFMNAVAEMLTGWNQKDASGRPLDEVFRIVNEHTRAAVESPVTKVLREGTIVGLANHTVLIARDGTELAIEDSGAPIIDEKLVGVVLVFRDATAERAAERALLASERRFRAAVDAVEGVVWTNTAEGEMRGEQPGWAALTGLAFDDYQGYGWAKAVHPDDAQPTIDAWNAAVAERRLFMFEHRVRRHDGEWRAFSVRAIPSLTDAGAIAEWVGIHTDITARKAAEEALRVSVQQAHVAEQAAEEAAAQFTSLADNISQLAWMAEPDGSIFWYNKRWYEYTGTTFEAMQGWGWQVVHDPNELPKVLERWRGAIAKGEPFDMVFPLKGADGEFRAFLTRIVPVKDEAGNVTRWFGTNTDISERLRAEESLRKTEAALREADQRKDVFLATLSHELRNPLAPIRNAASILESGALKPEDIERSRLIIARQVRHMASLLDDLLGISRITRGVYQLKKGYANLQGLLAEALETARPIIEAKRHRITLDWPPEPIEVEADPVRLIQIMTNLLTNAAKYTDPEGQIFFGARIENDLLIISVRDTGIGLAPEMLPKVFEMFSQVDPNQERTEGGLGIGLALVKGLAELHGGRIEARSDGLERGSEFTVFLPCLHVDTASREPLPAEPPKPKNGRNTILIADDNRDGAESMKMLLELSGHEVHTAHTGSEALEVAAQLQPAVVILDIGMPGLSGYEVATKIRSQVWGAQMTLIAMTGWGQEDDKRKAKEAGFDHHLTKPVDPDILEQLFAPRSR